ncbi:MAG: DNA-directed RNA polymerase subunit epsilon [Enterococcus sp.]|nr:DNA-directed RNA polymerase subunit epsilon [Enterococcus sp.]
MYKVYYQETKERNPKREQTQSIYVEADNEEMVHNLLRDNTPYNVEYIQLLEGNHLEYEKENADFKLAEF